jgi:hypothetical protein
MLDVAYTFLLSDGACRHRGIANPLEYPIGRWTLLAVCAALAIIFFSPDDTGWALALSIGLLAISMFGFYRASRPIKRGYQSWTTTRGASASSR